MYVYFSTIRVSNLILTGFATTHQIWLNLLQINQCFQELLDADRKHYRFLSKVKAEGLAAFLSMCGGEVWSHWPLVVLVGKETPLRHGLWGEYCALLLS